MRFLRYIALVGSVGLIVALAVWFVARHSQLRSERDLTVQAAAETAAARVSGLADAVTVAATLGGEPPAAASAVTDRWPGAVVCAAVDGTPTCATGVDVDDVEGADEALARRALQRPADGVIAADDGARVVVRADGDGLRLAAVVPTASMVAPPAEDGGERPAASLVLTEVEPASDRPTSVDDRRVVTAAVAGDPTVWVEASVPSDVSLDSDERLLLVMMSVLALLLLVLAAVTALSEHRTLIERASIDPLTRLPNRSEFERRGEAILAAAQRTETSVCLLLFDLDGFKAINDTHGHQAGDEVLRVIGARLRGAVRESDIVARWGGDEFVLVLPGIEEASSARSRALSLATMVAETEAAGGLRVGASVGIALFPRHGSTLPELVESADAAMYAAKRDGVTHRMAGIEAAPLAVPVPLTEERRQATRVRSRA